MNKFFSPLNFAFVKSSTAVKLDSPFDGYHIPVPFEPASSFGSFKKNTLALTVPTVGTVTVHVSTEPLPYVCVTVAVPGFIPLIVASRPFSSVILTTSLLSVDHVWSLYQDPVPVNFVVLLTFTVTAVDATDRGSASSDASSVFPVKVSTAFSNAPNNPLDFLDVFFTVVSFFVATGFLL